MRLILTGGGTGGHIYPALAVADECIRRDPSCQLLYIGSETGLEKQIVQGKNIPFYAIDISGFRRSLSWQNVRTLLRFIKGVGKVRRLIREFKPDVVVGTGGYVAGPVVYAAARQGVPCLIHEQNALPGLANRFLSRYADAVAVSFREAENHFPRARRVIYTGNPCATAVVHADAKRGLASLGIADNMQLVVIFGGSRGALALNEAMVDMMRFIPQLTNVHFLFVTGNTYFERTSARIKEKGNIPANVSIVPYLNNMPEVLAAAKLTVCRAGASSLAEITALGLPSILVPSPNVTGNHQEANARALKERGASIMILERELTGERLFEAIRSIVTDPIRHEYMSRRAAELGCPDAAQRVYEEILRLTRR